MRAQFVSAGLALLAGLLEVPLRAQSGPVIAVAPIESNLAPRDRIGKRQTGMICGPDGGLFWRDADWVPSAGQAAAVAALRAASLTAVPDAPASAVYTLAGKVVGVHLDACVAQHGRLVLLVGGRRTTKVVGTVTLAWTLRDRARAEIKSVADERPVRIAGANANVRQAVEEAIIASAKQLATSLAPNLKPSHD